MRIPLIHLRSAAIALALLAAESAARGEPVPAPKPGDRDVEQVDFARDVFPILARHCFDCHGSDVQEGQLRLDARATALAGGVSGRSIHPGHGDRSLLIQRLTTEDEAERMPQGGESLSPPEIAAIRSWIDGGAEWPDGIGAAAAARERHWAYVPPVRPAVPVVQQQTWPRSPVDAFILDRLEAASLSPSAPAARERLLRRVTFDLTGLPPSVEELDDFLADGSPDAWEKAVDRLLASPRYGERWAVPWLDAARYADSNGYQRDGRREAWAWRDWVIHALNADVPFDRFTLEQIAGDLLPGASLEQRIATGFHRNTMANVEAGTDPEEEHVLAVIDRVNTTGTVWLGTTLECAQCHNHKYDPFSQREYYQLYAFFNNTAQEIESDGSTREFTGPLIELPLAPDRRQQRERLAARIAEMKGEIEAAAAHLEAGQSEWELELAGSSEPPAGVPANILKIVAIASDERSDKQQRALREFYLAQTPEMKQLQARLKKLEASHVGLAPDTTLVMQELDEPRTTHMFQRGDFLQPGDAVEPGTPRMLHPLPPGDARPDRIALARWLVDSRNPLTARVTANRQWAQLFGRGIVETLEDFGTQGERPTHPELLDWLAVEFRGQEPGAGDDTSRVPASDPPASPLPWSLKRLHRLLVTSATYRQSAGVTPDLLRRDPYNALYSRGPRNRLPAEFVRDNALAIAGLLSQKLHGPPVFPYQPPGVWNHTGRASNVWPTSTGDDQHRRGLYVYWRRTVPYPSFVNFDAPSREACTVQRSRSNTPLQALTLLNDPAYFEAAVALAERMLAELSPGATPAERVEWAFRRATSRKPNPAEIEILAERLESEADRYRQDPAAVKRLLGDQPVPESSTAAELAGCVHVANVLLNLDEVISR